MAGSRKKSEKQPTLQSPAALANSAHEGWTKDRVEEWAAKSAAKSDGGWGAASKAESKVESRARSEARNKAGSAAVSKDYTYMYEDITEKEGSKTKKDCTW